MDIEVKELQAIDYDTMKQVDRSENIEVMYCARPLVHGLGLELQRVNQNPIIFIPHWSDEGIRKRISKWQPEIDNGGNLLAAVQANKIVGFGIISPKREDDSVELCALFVSSEARQSGAGTVLFQRLEKIAQEQGASSLLIYSNPTESAVDFYLKQKCDLISLADKRLVPHLPWDVVFAKSL